MERADFGNYLASRYVSKESRKPLSRRAVSDCMSRLRRVEKVLGIDVDVVPLDKNSIRQLVTKLKAVADDHGLSEFAIRDCTAALNRYAEFKQISRPATNRQEA